MTTAAKRGATTAQGRTDSLRTHPNIATAAKMLDVSASTVSRRDDLHTDQRGERDLVLAPSEVLRLARIYRKRSINEVALALIEHARAVDALDDQVEQEVEAFFSGEGDRSADEQRDLIAMAVRHLPPELAAEIKRTVDAGKGRRPVAITGEIPE